MLKLFINCFAVNILSQTTLHLLFFCDVSRHIWLASPWNLRTELLACDSLLDGIRFLWQLEAMDGSSHGSQAENRNIFLFVSVSFDQVWKCRNSVTHGGSLQDNALLVESIFKSYHSVLASVSRCKLPCASHWSPPPEGWIKINFDASLLGSRASIACVARNSEGSIIDWSCKRISATFPLLAEALAAELAIDLACHANWHSILLEGDSKTVLDSLSSRSSSSSWSISTLLDNCFCKLNAISVWHAAFAPRAHNLVAHNIARWENSFDPNSLLPLSLPPSVCLETEVWPLL
ncbi:hypothetical protein UlMin_023760 [Ulmus minor]